MWPASVDVPLDVLCANSWPHGCRVPFLVTSTTQRTFCPCTAGENSCMACHTQDDLLFPTFGLHNSHNSCSLRCRPSSPKGTQRSLVSSRGGLVSSRGLLPTLLTLRGSIRQRAASVGIPVPVGTHVSIGAHSCLLVTLCWNIHCSCCTVLARGRTVEDRNPLYFVSVASSGRPTLLEIS